MPVYLICYEINDVVCFPIFIKENYNKRIEKQKIRMFMILTWLKTKKKQQNKQNL